MVLSDFFVIYNIVLMLACVVCLVHWISIYRKKGKSKKLMFFSLVFVLMVCFLDNLFVTSKTVTTNEYYEIVEQKQVGSSQISKVELPHGKYEWVYIQDERVSDDGKKVELTVVQDYDWCGLLVNQYILNTCLYTG